MSSFFLPVKRSSKDRKRKKTVVKKRAREDGVAKKSSKKTKKVVRDEEIDSDSDIERNDMKKSKVKIVEDEEGEEEEEETAAEKRLRLAKEYISQVEEEELKKRDDAELDYDAIAHRLKEDVLREAGKLQSKVADSVCSPDGDGIRYLRGHGLSLTCVAIAPNNHFAFSGDKDGRIMKWDLESGVRVHEFKCQKRRRKRQGKWRGGKEEMSSPGHTGCVLALAISSDGTLLASGGKDGSIRVWSPETNTHIHRFTGHRDTVTGLVFQSGTHQLFSCALDRTVKIWNLDEMVYVETLFGHQDGVAGIDCLQREKPVTAGTNDRTVRLWKVVQESQLVFTGHKHAIDCVRLINEEHFITGSQDGSIAVWGVMKKKPLVRKLHSSATAKVGDDGVGVGGGGVAGERWVTAVAALPNTDLVASGSSNGHIVLWKCSEDFRSLEPCFTVEVSGFVNCLQFDQSGMFLVAAVGQEHRLGRWWRDSSVRNSIAIIPLPRTKN